MNLRRIDQNAAAFTRTIAVECEGGAVEGRAYGHKHGSTLPPRRRIVVNEGAELCRDAAAWVEDVQRAAPGERDGRGGGDEVCDKGAIEQGGK